MLLLYFVRIPARASDCGVNDGLDRYRDFCTLRTKVTEGLHFYDGVNASVCTLQKKVGPPCPYVHKH